MSNPGQRKASLVAKSNNVPARLIRQTGQSNLLKDVQEGEGKRVVVAAHRTRTNPVRIANPPVQKSTFVVYEDPSEDVENNIIHKLERQCKEEADKVKSDCTAAPVKKTSPKAKDRKPLTILHPNHDSTCSDSDDDIFSAVSQAPSGATVVRSELSNLGMDDDKDSQSAYMSAADDLPVPDVHEAPKRLNPCQDAIVASTEFGSDIYEYMRHREVKIRAKPNYMQKQLDINAEMRMILIDWLSDISVEYVMHQETLHLAVALVDRTLSRFRVERLRLQLVGASAMMIASKFEEIYPPDLKTMIYLTDDTYTAKQLVSMERAMLNELRFDVASPTVQWFGSLFARQLDSDKRTRHFLEYLMDLTLTDVSMLQYRPSFVAAACMCYARILNDPDAEMWSADMVKSTKILFGSLQHVGQLLHSALLVAPYSKQSSIYMHYSGPDKSEVALVEPPSECPF